jgi:DNA-binding NarL/FixJ family response regulator
MAINGFDYCKIIGEATNGMELLKLLEHHQPDIILMDIKMPLMNGCEATREALKRFPDLKIIALSMYGDEEHLQSMIDAGAKGFLLKNIRTDDLDRALNAVADGKSYYSEEFLEFFTKRFSSKPEDEELFQALTKRELEILQYIVDGYSNKEIANKLFISIRTVTNHRANINSKTGVNNTAKLIAFAIRHNLVHYK